MRRVVIVCALAVAVSTGLSGCERDPRSTPEGSLAAWVAAMSAAQSDLEARRHAYELLAAPARASLAERAARASQFSGRAVQPWEMLAPGRFSLRLQFDPDGLKARISGNRAVVVARGRGGDRAEIPMVREGNQWRVDLSLPPMQPIQSPAQEGP